MRKRHYFSDHDEFLAVTYLRFVSKNACQTFDSLRKQGYLGCD